MKAQMLSVLLLLTSGSAAPLVPTLEPTSLRPTAVAMRAWLQGWSQCDADLLLGGFGNVLAAAGAELERSEEPGKRRWLFPNLGGSSHDQAALYRLVPKIAINSGLHLRFVAEESPAVGTRVAFLVDEVLAPEDVYQRLVLAGRANGIAFNRGALRIEYEPDNGGRPTLHCFKEG